jgi:hypothetical protein
VVLVWDVVDFVAEVEWLTVVGGERSVVAGGG